MYLLLIHCELSSSNTAQDADSFATGSEVYGHVLYQIFQEVPHNSLSLVGGAQKYPSPKQSLETQHLGDSLFSDGQDSLDDVDAALAVVEVSGGELAVEDVKDDDAEIVDVRFKGEMAVLEASVGWTRVVGVDEEDGAP
ncbi:hypothetical protein ACLOJK_026572 [Asimina triloba]